MKFHCVYCGRQNESGEKSAKMCMSCQHCGSEIQIPPKRVVSPQAPSKKPTHWSVWGAANSPQRVVLYGIIGFVAWSAITAIVALVTQKPFFIWFGFAFLPSLAYYSITAFVSLLAIDRPRLKILGIVGLILASLGGLFVVSGFTPWGESAEFSHFSAMTAILSFAVSHAALMLMAKVETLFVSLLRIVAIAASATWAISASLVAVSEFSQAKWTFTAICAIIALSATIGTFALRAILKNVSPKMKLGSMSQG